MRPRGRVCAMRSSGSLAGAGSGLEKPSSDPSRVGVGLNRTFGDVLKDARRLNLFQEARSR
jgi:hypothetical protein